MWSQNEDSEHKKQGLLCWQGSWAAKTSSEEPKHVTSIVSLWDLEHTQVLTKKTVWISLNYCNKMQHNLYHLLQSVTPLSLFWGEAGFFECGSFWLQLSLEPHLNYCFCKSNYIELYWLWVPCHKTLNCLHGILQRTRQQGHLFHDNPADKQTTRYERNRRQTNYLWTTARYREIDVTLSRESCDVDPW
jgi:hypothetical protein